MHEFLIGLFVVVQALYLFGLLTTIWLLMLPIDRVEGGPLEDPNELPRIIMFYPVLHEQEATMRTTFVGMAKADYPEHLLRVIAIPNADDEQSLTGLRNVQAEFPFLEIMPVPPTTDPSWEPVWQAWEENENSYWWHFGKRAGVKDLPPKKTRQLVWAMYRLAPGNDETLLSYIDADSVIPRDYWQLAARGMTQYDVLQNTNITGNLLATIPASFHAMDHIAWDATVYRHMSAHGKHPFYVLGKGLFFRFEDLLTVGGFHPWITIEDPEIGMRLWNNGARLGIVESPLIEEVPATWWHGFTQRKRWVAGFFQSLNSPLAAMGMPWRQRYRARLNLVPCLSLIVNLPGFAIGAWAIVAAVYTPHRVFPVPVSILAVVTIALALCVLLYCWYRAWVLTALVLTRRRDRVKYVLIVNPLTMMIYWLWWALPLTRGFVMFLMDHGLRWERTEKIDANHHLIRSRAEAHPLGIDGAEELPGPEGG